MITTSSTRRSFLRTAAAIPFAARAFATQVQPAPTPKWVLLGTDKGKGIYRASWNAATGEIGAPQLAITADRPSFFARHPAQPILYSANESAHGDGTIGSFRIDRATGELTALQQLSAHGPGSCYVSVDSTRAYIANYSAGSFAAYTVKPDGGLVDNLNSFSCHAAGSACGPLGPVTDRQDAPHLHCATIAPRTGHIVVCDLGDDAILIFNPPQESVLAPVRIAARTGSGPRHVAFHPNGHWMYCIHELDCTIDLYEWRIRLGKPQLQLQGGSTISTLAKGAPLAGSTACEIVISDDGRFLYANTRGENSLVVYRIDGRTGLLTEQQHLSSGGTVTRAIAFDPSRRWLAACHQGSSGITVFPHDPETGKLGDNPRTYPAETPMCSEWV